jgi:hypothetical protein
MADEAAKAATHLLRMCVRALDYVPPVDITFGEYLRALLTADADLVRDDDRGYRVAVVEAFRVRGIYPPGVRSLAADSLLWTETREPDERVRAALLPVADEIMGLFNRWNMLPDRQETFEFTRAARESVRRWLQGICDAVGFADVEWLTGLALTRDAPATVTRGFDGAPEFVVHDVRPAQRVGPDGQLTQIITVELTQERAGYYDAAEQAAADRGGGGGGGTPEAGDFVFRGGCTLVIDIDALTRNTVRGAGARLLPRYVIRKDVLNDARLRQQREYLRNRRGASLGATYFGPGDGREGGDAGRGERFALLHREA